MKDIQDIITKRAEEKLKKDINTYFEQIRGNPLFSAIRQLKIIHQRSGEDVQTRFDDFFYAMNTWPGYDMIYKNLHDKYVETESNHFMTEFDRLKNDLDSLLSQ